MTSHGAAAAALLVFHDPHIVTDDALVTMGTTKSHQMEVSSRVCVHDGA